MTQSTSPPLDANQQPSSQSASASQANNALFSKVTRHLIPILFVCYTMANIDRVNIGIAQLQMKTDLGFSDAIYGLGAGIFFLSYLLFEVPSNLLMVRFGARRTLGLIMVGWGIVSSCTMLIHSARSFYALRFLLGVFEAGFYPGVIFYLTRWYPSTRRARALGLFSSGLALANVAGGLVSGWIMKGMGDALGLKGWQWLFLLEGLPCVLLGLLLLAWLDENIKTAKWLNDAEKRTLTQAIDNDTASPSAHGNTSFSRALANPRLYGFVLIYFGMIAAIIILSYWMPTIIHGFGIKDIPTVSMLSALPGVVAALAMVFVSAHAQHAHEYRWHLTLCCLIGAIALVLLPACGHHFLVAMVLLCISAGAIFATVPIFWALPSTYFTSSAAAGAIAMISSLGLISAFLSSDVTGWLKTLTGTFTTSLYVHAGVLALSGFITLVTVSRPSGSRAPDRIFSTDRRETS